MANIEVINGVKNICIKDENSVKKFTLIDVRNPDEFVGELGHIQGAQLFTLGPTLETFLKTANKNEDYLFICRSGGRSTQASLLAMGMGFTKVTNLSGGMLHWNELGLKIEK